jgi:uncharacterized repeat protein (TIGR03803 family)
MSRFEEIFFVMTSVHFKRLVVAATTILALCFGNTVAFANGKAGIVSFQSSASNPSGPLVQVGSSFYGTTYFGGTSACNCGTIYEISSSGRISVLYAFQGGALGNVPYDSLVAMGNTLYGVTLEGGTSGVGTVYSFTLGTNHHHVLHSFAGGLDGRIPRGALLPVNGLLYGTTSTGGSDACGGYGCGTVFAVSPQGAYQQIYDFKPYDGDGAFPENALTNVGGVLYGTTNNGGRYGDGTVFALATTGGDDKILHSFGGSNFADRSYQKVRCSKWAADSMVQRTPAASISTERFSRCSSTGTASTRSIRSAPTHTMDPIRKVVCSSRTACSMLQRVLAASAAAALCSA